MLFFQYHAPPGPKGGRRTLHSKGIDSHDRKKWTSPAKARLTKSDAARKRWAKMMPEQRHAVRKKISGSRSREEKSAMARKVHETRNKRFSKEQQRQWSIKGGLAKAARSTALGHSKKVAQATRNRVKIAKPVNPQRGNSKQDQLPDKSPQRKFLVQRQRKQQQNSFSRPPVKQDPTVEAAAFAKWRASPHDADSQLAYLDSMFPSENSAP